MMNIKVYILYITELQDHVRLRKKILTFATNFARIPNNRQRVMPIA